MCVWCVLICLHSTQNVTGYAIKLSSFTLCAIFEFSVSFSFDYVVLFRSNSQHIWIGSPLPRWSHIHNSNVCQCKATAYTMTYDDAEEEKDYFCCSFTFPFHVFWARILLWWQLCILSLCMRTNFVLCALVLHSGRFCNFVKIHCENNNIENVQHFHCAEHRREIRFTVLIMFGCAAVDRGKVKCLHVDAARALCANEMCDDGKAKNEIKTMWRSIHTKYWSDNIIFKHLRWHQANCLCNIKNCHIWTLEKRAKVLCYKRFLFHSFCARLPCIRKTDSNEACCLRLCIDGLLCSCACVRFFFSFSR